MNHKVPVLFLTFNRLEETKISFNKIIEYKPTHLYLASDGPRNNVESITVNLIREYLLTHIDWPCKVHTRFNTNNEGCRLSVSNSITWFFDIEEYGVIIEDDCVVDNTFFDFCLINLEKFKNNIDIWHIDGSNFVSNLYESNSIHFSKYFLIWGWASWRRAWNKYSLNMDGFDYFISNNQLSKVFQSKLERDYWKKQLTLAYNNEINTWDYQWFYTIWKNNGLSIRPNVNLVKNIGFSQLATHTKRVNKQIDAINSGKFLFPVIYDDDIFQDLNLDQQCSVRRFNILPLYKRIINKILL